MTQISRNRFSAFTKRQRLKELNELTIMSKQYFKAEIEYDNNMGSSDKETLYILEDNTSDCMSICTKDGRSVTLDGTDSYVEMLRHVLGLEDYEGIGESVKIIERTLPENFEIPDRVMRYFYPSRYKEQQKLKVI